MRSRTSEVLCYVFLWLRINWNDNPIFKLVHYCAPQAHMSQHRIKDFDCLHQFFPCERKVMPIQEVRKATFNLQQASLGNVLDFHPFTSFKIVCLHS